MDLVEILDEYRVKWHTTGPKCREGWVNLKCLWCDRDPYLGYCIATRACNCWNCGVHPLWEVIHRVTGLPPRACFDIAGQMPRSDVKFSRPRGKLKLPDGIESLTEHHEGYIVSRGLSPMTLKNTWSIRGIGQLGGRLKWRLFIPIIYRGEVVSWTTRSIIEGKEPRYVSTRREESSMPIEDLVYGIDYCCGSVIVTEGPVDAWAIGPGAVALLGQTTSPSRLEIISRVPNRIVCFDNEPDAQRRATRLCRDLSIFDGEVRNVRIDAKDPASASASEINKLREMLK